MIYKIYIEEHDKLHDIQNKAYYFAMYSCEYNMNLAKSIQLPERYPAILTVRWDESYDVNSLDWEYIYLTDFELGEENES